MKGFSHTARAVAWRSIRRMFSSPALLLPTVIPQLFVLIAFAGGLSKLSGVREFGYPLGYTAFIFVFASLQAATISGVFTGFAVARDFGTGFVRRLLLTAPTRSGIIAGYLAAAIVRWIVTGTIAAIIGGVRVAGNGIDIAGLLGLGLLANLIAALWACGTAMLLRTEQAGASSSSPSSCCCSLRPSTSPSGSSPAGSTTSPGSTPLPGPRSRTRPPRRNARRSRALARDPRRRNRRNGNLGTPGTLLS